MNIFPIDAHFVHIYQTFLKNNIINQSLVFIPVHKLTLTTICILNNLYVYIYKSI